MTAITYSAVDALKYQRTNPLVRDLQLFRTPRQLAEAVAPPPVNPDELKLIPPCDRISLSRQFPEAVVVTKALLTIQDNMQRMVADAYAKRDPRNASYARALFKLANRQRDVSDLQDSSLLGIDISYCGGMLVAGESGCGKSFATEALYSQWPAVIEHTAGAGEFAYLKQIVHLKVHMPADGQRGGFLTNAFTAIDALVGSSYASKYARLSIEKQLVKLLYVLALHRCGVLIIEEAQEKNLAANTFGEQFLFFFLRLLNWGVPVVLIGNPLAFVEMRKSVQLRSRFTEYGDFRLVPVDLEDPEWKSQWVPQCWRPFLTSQPDQVIENVDQIVWHCTGGIPRYLTRLRREAEIAALRCNSEQVQSEHVSMAFHGESMTGVHQVIEAFACKNLDKLGKLSDVDQAYFASKWSGAPDVHCDAPAPRRTVGRKAPAKAGTAGGSSKRDRDAAIEESISAMQAAQEAREHAAAGGRG